MEKNVDSLTSALRAAASEDADRAPARLDPRLIAALRAAHPAPSTLRASLAPGTSTRHPALNTRHSAPSIQHPWVGVGLAAALVAALSVAMWFVRSGAPSLATRSASSPGRGVRGEIATAFMPLTYSALPYTNAQIVRLEVPRSALGNFGLASTELPADASAASHNIVIADVLVGEDGLARAVRFVRAERAPGVAP